jgi:uncharacterized DUF497 family protein
MAFLQYVWDDPEDPRGNVEHVAQHGLTIEEVEHVLADPDSRGTSQSSGNPCCFGFTPAGEFIVVIYELIDQDTVYTVTAYHVDEP